MLLIINAFRLSIPDADIAKLDVTSLSSLMTNAKIQKALEDGTYFNMPLIRREEITRYKNVLSQGKL
jgi:hypothetical protein